MKTFVFRLDFLSGQLPSALLPLRLFCFCTKLGAAIELPEMFYHFDFCSIKFIHNKVLEVFSPF